MRKITKPILIVLIVCLSLGLLGSLAVAGINSLVVGSTQENILSPADAAQLSDVDCILVLGCGVWGDNQPSHMLADRLQRSVELYKAGAAPKLLMTGDHGRENYNEVSVMKQYAIDAGIPAENIFMDHAGFSTYESLYRAKDIFCAEKIIIISQEYHLYRALYIAEELGLEAYGVSANYRSYGGQLGRDLREILARCKDFTMTLFWPRPTYLGDQIPISGNGNATND